MDEGESVQAKQSNSEAADDKIPNYTPPELISFVELIISASVNENR